MIYIWKFIIIIKMNLNNFDTKFLSSIFTNLRINSSEEPNGPGPMESISNMLKGPSQDP